MDIIKTERLLIRRIEKEDWRDLKEIWERFAISEYACYDRMIDTNEATMQNLTAIWASFCSSDEHMLFAVCLEDKTIGYISFSRTETGYELGYNFNSAYHHKGYATESLKALFDLMRLKECRHISAGTAMANIPSVNLLSRLGFICTGKEQVSFYKDKNGKDIVFEGGVFKLNL